MKLLTTAAVALFAAAPAFAADTLLTFETVSSFASVAQYYNGGADGEGNIGPNYGVVFGDDALGLLNDELGPYFSNAPSPLGVLAPVGPDATMNVAAGFVGAVSFFYSSNEVLTRAVEVWSGLNGSGTLLASFTLVGNAQAGGCSDSAFCRWDQISSTFSGVAHSLTFTNATGAGFDNIAITTVPEPTSALLLTMGVIGLSVLRRRR